MRIVYSPDALKYIFTKQIPLNAFELGILNTHKISINSKILKDYENHLNGNQHYQDWLSNLYQHHLVSTFGNSPNEQDALVDKGKNLDHYALASYISDQRITSLNACGPWTQPFIDNINIKKYLSSSHPQNNPYRTLVLHSNGTIGFDIFDKYLSLDSNIYLYDQYINRHSCALIDYIAKKSSAKNYIKVFLFKEDGNCLSVSQLEKKFNAHKNLKFYKVNASTAAKIHDRFINFGQRIQVTLSKGLDQFGPIFSKNSISGFSNSDSEINFYDVYPNLAHHRIECANGGALTLSKRHI